jgi:PAS domain S-box-containing protein
MIFNLPVLVAYVDGERRFQFANSTYREWPGLDPEEIVGRLTHEVLDADYVAAIEPYVQRVLNGERVEYEVEARLNGNQRVLRGVLVPRRVHHQSADGYYLLVQDVTERRALLVSCESRRQGAYCRARASRFTGRDARLRSTPVSCRLNRTGQLCAATRFIHAQGAQCRDRFIEPRRPRVSIVQTHMVSKGAIRREDRSGRDADATVERSLEEAYRVDVIR